MVQIASAPAAAHRDASTAQATGGGLVREPLEFTSAPAGCKRDQADLRADRPDGPILGCAGRPVLNWTSSLFEFRFTPRPVSRRLLVAHPPPGWAELAGPPRRIVLGYFSRRTVSRWYLGSMSQTVESLRAEMHAALDARDAAKKAHEAGTGTFEAVEAATQRAYEATDLYFDAMRVRAA